MGLLRLFARPDHRASFAPGRVGYAVGDIHGRADLLDLMLDKLEQSAAADQREGGAPIVVFLGDYVDRGPESARVIDLLLSGRPRGFETRFLCGNHEQAMLSFMADPVRNLAWINYGGTETLDSYGVTPPALGGSTIDDWIDAAEALHAKMPTAHLDFFIGLERYVVIGDYVFVHAGVDTSRPLERQTDSALFWSRERFLNGRRPFSHRVVHGHTPAPQPFADERRVGIDTGAYASGILTAARIEGAEVSFLTAEAVPRGRVAPIVRSPGAV